MDDLWQPLATRLAERMEEEALGAEDLATRTGLDPDTVRRLLAGRPVRGRSLQLVVEALGLDWAQVMTRWAAATSSGRRGHRRAPHRAVASSPRP